jgi:hypothetical protein
MGPFDRFNDRAKRTLALAQDEAVITRAASLAAERNHVGATVLASVGATPQRIRQILDRMNG